MDFGSVFPGILISRFFWQVVVRRDKFGLNTGKIRTRAWTQISNFGQGRARPEWDNEGRFGLGEKM